jgi:hypothetical protein
MTPASLVGSAASNPYPIRCLLGRSEDEDEFEFEDD